LSTNSAHRVIDGATHASLISDEEDAAAATSTSSHRSGAQGRWSGDPMRNRERISIHSCWSSTVLAASASAPKSLLARSRLRPPLNRRSPGAR
jgi:hypothetical protein